MEYKKESILTLNITFIMIEIVISVIAFCLNGFLGLFVYYRNRKSWTNRFLSALTLVINGYIVFNYISLHPPTPQSQLFWIRVVMFETSLLGPALFLLAHTFPGPKIQLKKRYLLALAFLYSSSAIASLTPLVFSSIQYPNGQPVPVPGIGFPIFFLDFVGLVLLSVVLLIVKYIKSKGIAKIQLFYFLTGIAGTFTLMAITTVIFVSLLKRSDFVFIGPISSLFLILCITYAIIRHRFLDIRLLVARSVAFTLLLIIFGLVYTGEIFLVSNFFFQKQVETSQAVTFAVLALFIAFTFQPLKNLLEKGTDRVFFKGKYNSDELVLGLSQIMASTIRLEELTKQTLRKLLLTIHITRGGFLLFNNHDKYTFVHEGYSIQSDFEMETLNKLKGIMQIVVLDEEENQEVREFMRSKDLSIAIPLTESNHREGLLLLGEKKSGDIYSEQDIQVLQIFATQAAVAIRNAKSFEEISKFNITLKEEVARETKQLQDLTEQQKDQVDIMGHEVKTPLTAISQQLNLLLEMILTEQKREEWLKGNVQPEDAKRVIEGLKKMQIAEMQEESIVANMIEAARLDKLTFELDYSTFDLIDLVKSAIKDSEGRLEANKQKGRIIFQSELSILDVDADKTRIKQCIDGLLTNAEKYGINPQAHSLDITVSVTTDNQIVVISVHDQGMGIDPQDMEKLGKKFSRLNSHINGSKLSRPVGSGLGLYTYKGIMEHHKGKLIIDSEGHGRGATFTLRFPIHTSRLQ